jgi:hypothetical protein
MKGKRVHDFVRVTASGEAVFFEGNPKIMDVAKPDETQSADYAKWGANDTALIDMANVCHKNPTKWRLMITRRDFVIAKGLVFKKRLTATKTKEASLEEVKDIEAFFKRFEIAELFEVCALMLEFGSRYGVRVKLGTDKKISEINYVDINHYRPAKLKGKERKITKFVINPNFGSKNYNKADDYTLPAYDPQNPTAKKEFLLDVKEIFPLQYYHPFGIWWGTEDWARVTNKIPLYHENGLDNGYNIKYHVRYPADYFDDEDLSDEECEALETAVLAKINDTLRGKADTVFFTKYDFDIGNKIIKGVEVTALPNNMSDDAFVGLYRLGTETQNAAHGILPVLGAIDTGSKMGGSGKEMEVAAQYTQNFLTPSYRRKLLKIFEMCKDIELWPEEIIAEFSNIAMYNPDVTPEDSPANPNNPDKAKEDDPDEEVEQTQIKKDKKNGDSKRHKDGQEKPE